jgi:hypothetical protein
MADPTRAPAFATPVFFVTNPGAATANITTATSTLVHTGAGTFLGISVNTAHSGAQAVVYDGTDDTGAVLGTFALTTQGPINTPGAGLPFTTGLFVVTTGGTPADITVSYAA